MAQDSRKRLAAGSDEQARKVLALDATTTVDTFSSPSLYLGSILEDKTEKVNILPARIRDSMPHEEPKPGSKGYIYRVLEPFYLKESVDNVTQAMAEGQISSGSKWPRELAREVSQLYNVDVVLPTSSGASALTVALLACRLGHQDQVLVPAFTMVAVANAVKMVGAKPVYCDCAEGSLNPSCKELEEKATPLTKVVIVCHTYGVACKDIKAIAELCKRKGWWLIEDICEAMGTKAEDGSLVGTFGDFGITSLYANKQITAGDGGWVHARDPKYHDRIKSLLNHGFDPSYHFLHFETAPNAKMNGLGAAFVCAQVKLLPDIMLHRSQVATWYRTHLDEMRKGLPEMNELTCIEKGRYDAPWVFGIEVKDRDTRDKLRNHLAASGIETRNYFYPLHLEPVNFYSGDAGVYDIVLPRAEKAAQVGFYLPSHTYLREADIKFICYIIRCFYEASLPEDKRWPALSCPQQSNEWVSTKRTAQLTTDARPEIVCTA